MEFVFPYPDDCFLTQPFTNKEESFWKGLFALVDRPLSLLLYVASFSLHLYSTELGTRQLFSFATTTMRQCNGASETGQITTNVKAYVTIKFCTWQALQPTFGLGYHSELGTRQFSFATRDNVMERQRQGKKNDKCYGLCNVKFHQICKGKWSKTLSHRAKQ